MKTNLPNKGQSLIRIIIVLLVVGLFTGGLYYFFARQIPEGSEITEIAEISKEERLENRVFYIINKGSEDIKEYQLEITGESTVFALLEELAVREGFEVKTTLYPEMGVFVNSIDGFEGGTDNKWWQYWVNGKLGEVAADKKGVKEGDIIEWKFEVPLEF